MNELRLESATWEGDGRSYDFLDYVIDDQSLFDWIRWCSEDPDSLAWLPGSKVTPFNPTLSDGLRRDAHRRLVLRGPPDLGHRTSLYVCPRCGDLGCGAVAAVIAGAGDAVTWSDLVLQGSGPEPPRPLPVGPFTFERSRYLDALILPY